MKGKLPPLKPRELVAVLEKAGFLVDHQVGGHLALRHPQTRRKVTIPMHPRELPPDTQRVIIKQAGLTRQQFLQLV